LEFQLVILNNWRRLSYHSVIMHFLSFTCSLYTNQHLKILYLLLFLLDSRDLVLQLLNKVFYLYQIRLLVLRDWMSYHQRWAVFQIQVFSIVCEILYYFVF